VAIGAQNNKAILMDGFVGYNLLELVCKMNLPHAIGLSGLFKEKVSNWC
jgi:hypothetical protein